MLKHMISLVICVSALGCAQSRTAGETAPAGPTDLVDSTIAAPELRAELLAMAEKDQAVRRELIAAGADNPDRKLLEKVIAVDSANTARIREIVAEHGWPGAALVGTDGCSAAFIIVQHAAQATQEEMLPLVEAAFRAGDLEGQSYALLLDRVLMKRGEPQVYGTQILSFDQWEDGRPAAYPIADEEHVDERRAEMGLPPLADYLEMVKRVYFPGDREKETDKENEDL
jgi:hypothetical protein